MPVPEPFPTRLPAGDRWTATDLDNLPDNGIRYEVLNGQLIVNAAPKPKHQVLLQWLQVALLGVLPEGYWLLPGIGVLIGDDEPIPDLVAGTGERPMEERGVKVEHVVLAVEIVSASTTLQDRMVKPAVYAEAGIPNYWRIEANPFKGRLPGETLPVLFAHALGDNGEYELTHRIPAGEPATLHSPFEFTIDPAALLR
ncbi:Uma2 family endonuclease [Nocardia sp. BMG51109]|uniref:Uma2 family endonuclease n=1 Tax=Nocardia sp. BMG51109 TaxID=1056816 RepID=UPI000465C832|nr:Uma2 family endonuclease [Nocardia sp. BMG51109]